MAITLRTYRDGTLVDTQATAPDPPSSQAVATTGWPAGSYSITITQQKANESESVVSEGQSLTVEASGLTFNSSATVTQTLTTDSRTIVSPAFTAQAGLIVVLVGGIPDSGADRTPTMTGTGLTFTRRTGIVTAWEYVCEIWTAPTTGVSGVQITYDAGASLLLYANGGLAVCSLSGPNATPIGSVDATAVNGSAIQFSSALNCTVGSMLFGIQVSAYDGCASVSAGSGSTVIHTSPQFQFVRSTSTVSAGSNTISTTGQTNPNASDASCGIEILAA